MEKILVVAEKPSVGRDLARVLNCRQKQDGFIEGEKYIVTWCIGHLVTLFNPEDYDASYKRWHLEPLPILPDEIRLKVVDKVAKQYEVIKMLMKSTNVTSLVCATDAGREGELIFRYVYKMAGCNKPFGRLWISSMVDKAIEDGFEKIKPGKEFDNLYESARCRSEADWLVGINITRAYTVRYGNLFSVGRVQTPTLAILVQRQEEINKFVPKDYWEILADYGNFTGLWYNKEEKETRTYKQEQVIEVVQKVKGKNGIIAAIEEEDKKDLQPFLYDLNELQRDANRKFGFSAKKTLGLAQDLYEKYKAITYPRTDSRFLTADMIPELRPLIKTIGESSEAYTVFTEHLLSQKKLQITKRIVDDKKVSDHHAIIPTGKMLKMAPEHEQIFNLVVLRLLAVFYPEHLYTVTTVTAEVRDETFISKGKMIKQEGWKEVYKGSESGSAGKEDSGGKSGKNGNDDEGSKDQTLPQLKVGDEVKVHHADVLEKKTKPPAHYTEATLLGAMEHAGRFVEDEELKSHLRDRGLGTAATRAGIIERIIDVGYVERKGKKLIPTNKGTDLIKIVPELLKSPEMTGEWEQRLNYINKGKLNPDEFIRDIRSYVKYVVAEAKKFEIKPLLSDDSKRPSGTKIDGSPIATCPVCKEGEIVGHSKGYRCTNLRKGCSFSLALNILGKYIPPEQIAKMAESGETDIIKGFTSKNGKQFSARLSYTEAGKLQFKFK